jgi:hypothetical protein
MDEMKSAVLVEEKSATEKILCDLKVTAGARFNAAERLAKKEKSSSRLVSVYSAVLICVSIATFALPLDSNVIRYVSFGGIVASILLLVASMRSSSHQYGIEAEQMHRCALELNELRRVMLAQKESAAGVKLGAFVERQNAILQKWSINHTTEDYLKYKYRHKWAFDDIKDTPDDELPDLKFKELYDVSAGGVAALTLVGIVFAFFVGYVVLDSIGGLYGEDDLPTAEEAMRAADEAINAAEAAAQAATEAAERPAPKLGDAQPDR